MENIKITVKIISLSAFGVALINSLVADKKQAKTVNFITGLIFLLSVLTPLIKSDFNFDFSKLNNISVKAESVEVDKNSLVLSETEKRLEEMLINDLKEREIAVKRLKVKCSADSEASVTIEKIICEIIDSGKIEFVKGILRERAGNEACLTVY